MAPLLSEADRARISSAIAKAEASTSGEIYCVVTRRISDYRFVPVFWGAIASLLLPAIVLLLGLEPHRWPLIGEPWWTGEASDAEIFRMVRSGMATLVLAQILAFLAGAALTIPMPVRLRAVPSAVKRDLVHRAALDQFLARGMQRTVARTGVLIFVALGERQVEVVADEGIYGKVDPAIWDDAVGALLAAGRENRLAEGFVEAIALCGGVLAEHFPPRPDDRNELPDHVVEL
jgi:putative membrane protein